MQNAQANQINLNGCKLQSELDVKLGYFKIVGDGLQARSQSECV
jgi:hypothetical protein